ncbi:dihydrodipicolinate synthase family protein [Paenibacillus sp. IB182496]|uniref:Dihydrodipicolinate synthase family protein n=1 Tax=Paenibacillus sabuli TaxID=2772509 RepID=A0A927BRE4_9BACL|nr:dihydrodipicolinate synthase family protein [Paenibacillus sabuli]MBD2845367.1 dihydrodipicolinate synthase family protein [Paenibacillus sabuli]
MKAINNGVWPTMITPFGTQGELDKKVLAQTVEWYIARGVDGLFAVCQSSEMFFLSLEERVKLAALTRQYSDGRVPVIASGHVSGRFEDQVEELLALADTGVDALVLITNRLAALDESDSIWLRNLERLLAELPAHIALGLYECPYPYKRLLSSDLLRACADTGRFRFLKDTSCDVSLIRAKLEAVEGTALKIFNANAATLLPSLQMGAAGYSGIMANFHPELYVWLTRHWQAEPRQAEELAALLSLTALIEKQLYPVNAKYFLSLEGVYKELETRVQASEAFSATDRLEIEQLRLLAQRAAQQLGIQTALPVTK